MSKTTIIILGEIKLNIPRIETKEVQDILKNNDSIFEKARAIYYYNYNCLCKENPFDKIRPKQTINDILFELEK